MKHTGPLAIKHIVPGGAIHHEMLNVLIGSSKDNARRDRSVGGAQYQARKYYAKITNVTGASDGYYAFSTIHLPVEGDPSGNLEWENVARSKISNTAWEINGNTELAVDDIIVVWEALGKSKKVMWIFSHPAVGTHAAIFEITAISADTPFDDITAKQLVAWDGETPDSWIGSIAIRDYGLGCPKIGDRYQCVSVPDVDSGTPIWTFCTVPSRLKDTT